MRNDKFAAARRARLVQALFLMAGIGAFLVVMLLTSIGDARAMAFFGALLLIPIGSAWVMWDAHQRDTRARADGSWTKELNAREQKKTLGRLGTVLVVAVALAVVAMVAL